MPKGPLFSTYRQGENRVTSSVLAVFERVDLAIVERLLGAAAGGSSDEMVRFVNQPGGGGGSVPDASISASFHYLFEVKTEVGAVWPDQLRSHLTQLRPAAQLQRLYVLTPDPEEPPEIEQIGDERVAWFNFTGLDQAIRDFLGDPDEAPSEREAFLLRELQRLFEDDGLLAPPEDVVVVAARSAYPEYLRHSAYLCQVGRFRPGITRVGFYTAKAIRPEFPLVLHRVPIVPLTETEAARLEASSDEWDSLLAAVVRGRLSDDLGSEGSEAQVFLLSAPDSAATLMLAHPIEHTRRGAWTQSHRYVSSADLERQPRTTDELA